MKKGSEPLLFDYQRAHWKALGRTGLSTQNRRNEAHRFRNGDEDAPILFARASTSGRMLCANSGCERLLDFGEDVLLIAQVKPGRHTGTLAYCSVRCQRSDHMQSAAYGLRKGRRTRRGAREKSQ